MNKYLFSDASQSEDHITIGLYSPMNAPEQMSALQCHMSIKFKKKPHLHRQDLCHPIPDLGTICILFVHLKSIWKQKKKDHHLTKSKNI